ncbi:MAG: 4Fe-4S dicluster domain-containing protein [Desulfacinum sp.]|jgi:heterodisulfide reductase subunit C|nr:4Fe-4S dicluster domain-containing protein [Desulfacinum sp.]
MDDGLNTARLRVNDELAERVLQKSRIQPTVCYQCRKCTSGCPLTFAMDHPPDRIVRFLILGLEERVLRSRTIWVCSSCETCTTRCPNDIDIAGLMDHLKEEAHARGIVPPECRPIHAFHEAFLEDVARRGRVFEAGLLQRYMLTSGVWKSRLADGTLWSEVRTGLALLRKGRLPLLPKGVQARDEIRRIFQGAGDSEAPSDPVHASCGPENTGTGADPS